MGEFLKAEKYGFNLVLVLHLPSFKNHNICILFQFRLKLIVNEAARVSLLEQCKKGLKNLSKMNHEWAARRITQKTLVTTTYVLRTDLRVVDLPAWKNKRSNKLWHATKKLKRFLLTQKLKKTQKGGSMGGTTCRLTLDAAVGEHCKELNM